MRTGLSWLAVSVVSALIEALLTAGGWLVFRLAWGDHRFQLGLAERFCQTQECCTSGFKTRQMLIPPKRAMLVCEARFCGADFDRYAGISAYVLTFESQG
jgi:hypothetical protein